MNLVFQNFREVVIRCLVFIPNRGKSGHHRTGFLAKARGACIKASSRQVQQKINRLFIQVRVKWWGKVEEKDPSQLHRHETPIFIIILINPEEVHLIGRSNEELCLCPWPLYKVLLMLVVDRTSHLDEFGTGR